MDIKPGRMISLGYGKYWRSDEIVGLMPIETERGPGRRTDVYVSTLDHPIVASRTETAILQDMAQATDDTLQMEHVREVISDMLASLTEVPDVLRRSLDREAGLDVDAWIARFKTLLRAESAPPQQQNDLFT